MRHNFPHFNVIFFAAKSTGWIQAKNQLNFQI